MKVSYWRLEGYESKAYLDEEVEPGIWVGTNKHTDETVKVMWTGSQWQEI